MITIQRRVVKDSVLRVDVRDLKSKSLRSRCLYVRCAFVGLIRHTRQIRELSVFNGAKENAEDAEMPRTQTVECLESLNNDKIAAPLK